MSWHSLSDFELIKAEVALCEGALYVGASHADMYYQMSYGTKSTGERKERVEAILTAMFFNSPDVFLPGEYTIEYRESELLLVGLTSTDYGWHNGYDQDTVESAHHEMCSCFKEELLALGLSEEEINTAIASEAIYITASFGPDDKGSMTAEGALEVMLDTVEASFEINDANSHYVTNPLWELCQGWNTTSFEGGIEGTHISSLVEYSEQVENLKDWLSGE